MTGVHTNNEAISPCTARSVSAVLGSGAMTGCLETRGAGHCGDGEVDRGEQCDCGDQVMSADRELYNIHNVSGDLCLHQVPVCPPWPEERTDPVHAAA